MISVKEVIENKTYRLLPISPILIQGGDGSGDYGQAFVRSPYDTDFIYLIDQNKFRQFLYEKGGLQMIEQFISWLNDTGSKGMSGGLTEFLNKIKFDFNNIKSISKGKVYARQKARNDYFFIRNGMNRAYIPGTSIKGVIKTAVLWKILKEIKNENPEKFKQHIKRLIEKGINKYQLEYNKKLKNKQKEEFSASILKEVFQNYILQSEFINERHTIEKIPSPFTDLFRAIKVKDSSSIDKKFLFNKQWNVLSLDKKNNPYLKMPKNFNLEIFFNYNRDPACFVDFEITLDNVLLKNFKNSKRINSFWSNYSIPFSNISELLEIVNDFSNEIWNYLSNYYGNVKNKTSNGININRIYSFYQNNTYSDQRKMKIGWGTGLLGTTFALLLQDSVDLKDMLIKLRDKVISSDGKEHGEFVPKSARVVCGSDGQPEYPLGWASIEEVDLNV